MALGNSQTSRYSYALWHVTGGFELQRQKAQRLTALCEASRRLQSRLRTETQRFQSDFNDVQGSVSLFSVYVYSD